jgi:hypothetical protein
MSCVFSSCLWSAVFQTSQCCHPSLATMTTLRLARCAGVMYIRGAGRDARGGPSVLVLAPTRELAVQTKTEADRFGHSAGYGPAGLDLHHVHQTHLCLCMCVLAMNVCLCRHCRPTLRQHGKVPACGPCGTVCSMHLRWFNALVCL